ncbi:hypothetical protein ACLI09_07425 [Flavobacterium sp. RHBU_24]|uniref:hypothetical protein n=1 Tax=Flavobacterium sp. RHBU_24 TaxID=3391185 RepID=UPI0039852A1A
MNYPTTLRSIIAVFCFMTGYTAVAQNQEITRTAAVANTTATPAPESAAKAETAKDLNVLSTLKAQFAETKMQRRKRKKNDPILLPYSLTKKSYSLS